MGKGDKKQDPNPPGGRTGIRAPSGKVQNWGSRREMQTSPRLPPGPGCGDRLPERARLARGRHRNTHGGAQPVVTPGAAATEAERHSRVREVEQPGPLRAGQEGSGSGKSLTSVVSVFRSRDNKLL